MSRKHYLLRVLFCMVALAIIFGIVMSIHIYLREQDANWQVANEIYNVQAALQVIDEEGKLESLSDVRPFVIKGPNDVVINYYCCITSYLNEEPDKIEGLNKKALDLVVDIDSLENQNDCKVGSCGGVMGELDGLTYLCWTISPKYSCVMEYTAGTVAKEDIFRMAESVSLP